MSATRRAAALTAALLLETTAMAAAPLTGRWGGDRLNLTLTDAGATLQWDCQTGGFGGAVRPTDGAFEADGWLTASRPGPDRIGAAEARTLAGYEGRFEGDTLVLVVRAAGRPAATFRLVRDRPVKLVRCL